MGAGGEGGRTVPVAFPPRLLATVLPLRTFSNHSRASQCWGVYYVPGPVPSQTFPRSNLRLTITFQATEEHRS